MNGYLQVLPERVRSELEKQSMPSIEEIRLRVGQPPGAVIGGKALRLANCDAPVSREEIERLLRAASAPL